MKYAVHGFTLIELMISLTILSIIVLLVFAGLQTGIRVWESGGQKIEMLQHQRIVLSLIKQQLAEVITTNRLTPAVNITAPTGDAQNLSFYSGMALIPDNANLMVKVNYQIETASFGGMFLTISEQPVDTIKLKSTEESGLTDNIRLMDDTVTHRFTVLFEEISLAYLLPSAMGEGALEWADRCNTDNADIIPLAVRLCIRGGEELSTGKPLTTCIIAQTQR